LGFSTDIDPLPYLYILIDFEFTSLPSSFMATSGYLTFWVLAESYHFQGELYKLSIFPLRTPTLVEVVYETSIIAGECYETAIKPKTVILDFSFHRTY